MKEQDLIDLGFERTDVSEVESGGDAFYYYTLDFSKNFSLITPPNTDIKRDDWCVELFESPEVNFIEKKDIKQFINIIKRNTHARKIK